MYTYYGCFLRRTSKFATCVTVLLLLSSYHLHLKVNTRIRNECPNMRGRSISVPPNLPLMVVLLPLNIYVVTKCRMVMKAKHNQFN
jgi:hypothetical protein